MKIHLSLGDKSKLTQPGHLKLLLKHLANLKLFCSKPLQGNDLISKLNY